MSVTHASIVRKDATPMVSALAFFFLLTSYYIIRPVRDQLSGAVGSFALPTFYATTLITILLVTPVFGWLVARFARRRLLGWVYSFFISNLLLFIPAFVAQDRIGAHTLGIIFFTWVSVFNLFAVSLFWSFMADVFDSRRARAIFPLIAMAGMAGAIFGPFITALLIDLLGVAPLLLVSALMLGASLGLMLFISAHRVPGSATEAPIGGSLWAGVRQLWSRPFLRYMALLMLFGDGVGTLAYALVADYAKAHLTSTVERTAFYNRIDLATNVIGAILQFTITRWLLMRRGVAWVLVLPMIANVALLLMVAAGGYAHISVWGYAVPLLVILMVLTRSFAYGMIKPAADALYTRVPREMRYKGKNFVETAVWRFGDLVITSGISGLDKLGATVGTIAFIGAGIASASAWVARKAARSSDLLPEGVGHSAIATDDDG